MTGYSGGGCAMITLREALNRVWQDDRPRLESAADALVSMDDAALLDMLKVLLLAQVGDRIIVDDKIDQGALYLRYREGGLSTLARLGAASAANAIMRLTDIGRSLVADDGFRTRWGEAREYRACNILGAEQFARDHIDTLLYEPVSIRERHLQEIADDLGIPADLLVKLATYVRAFGPASMPTTER
jgi:hypothetical protein